MGITGRRFVNRFKLFSQYSKMENEGNREALDILIKVINEMESNLSVDFPGGAEMYVEDYKIAFPSEV